MHPFLQLAAAIPILVLSGCGLGGGGTSSSGSAGGKGLGLSASGAPVGDIAMISSYPRVTLQQAAPGSARSLLTVTMIITNSTGADGSYEVLVDGISRIVGSLQSGVLLQDDMEVDAGRHRVVVRLDPDAAIAETDEGNNESLIVVDVPTATAPASRSGNDIAYGYPPYVTYTPMPEQDRPQVWSFLVMVPMRNNGTTVLNALYFGCAGDLGGTTGKSGTYAPGLVATVGVGRGALANQPMHVVLTLDPENTVSESDEGNNSFTLDFVTPPGPDGGNG